jgi:hypothetical protein
LGQTEYIVTEEVIFFVLRKKTTYLTLNKITSICPINLGQLTGRSIDRKIQIRIGCVFLFDLIPTPHNDSDEPASSITQPDKKTTSKSKSQTPNSSSLLIDKDWVFKHVR